MEPITLSVPIYLQLGKKNPKTFSLNLNTYRNAHFQILNQAKKQFEELVSPLVRRLAPMSRLVLTYSLFFGSKRAVDTSNVCCIVDKFFSDTLTINKIIPDDNKDVISDVHYRFGGIDTQNPRIEVTISDYEIIPTQEDPMKIILVQAEIEEALKAYVLTQIAVKDGQAIDIEFRNTRGDDGATAEITIQPATAVSPVPVAPAAEAKPQRQVRASTAPVGASVVPPAKSAEPVANDQAMVADRAEAAGADDAVSPVSEAAEDAVEEPVEVAAAVKPAAPAAASGGGKSLFAGLIKPTNS